MKVTLGMYVSAGIVLAGLWLIGYIVGGVRNRPTPTTCCDGGDAPLYPPSEWFEEGNTGDHGEHRVHRGRE